MTTARQPQVTLQNLCTANQMTCPGGLANCCNAKRRNIRFVLGTVFGSYGARYRVFPGFGITTAAGGLSDVDC